MTVFNALKKPFILWLVILFSNPISLNIWFPSKFMISDPILLLTACCNIDNKPRTICASESISIKNKFSFLWHITHDLDAHPIIKFLSIFKLLDIPLLFLPISINYSNLSSWLSNNKKLFFISSKAIFIINLN